jgi:hypothetical protein
VPVPGERSEVAHTFRVACFVVLAKRKRTIVMAAVAGICRDGAKLHVARDVLYRAPLLLNACSEEPQHAEEEVSLDRDPAVVRLVLEYCESGIITQQMLTDAFFIEADYFGIAPLTPLLQSVRETLSYEDLCYDASIFIERLINTNILRELEFSDDVEQGAVDPVFQLMVKCSRYEPRDRWPNTADAFKYAVAYPDILRTVAFTRFGASLTWEVKSVVLDVPEIDHDDQEEEDLDCDDEMIMPRSGGRVIYSEPSWRADSKSDSTVAAGVSRFGHTATEPASSVTPCDHGVVSMQNDSVLQLHCGEVSVEFKVRTRLNESDEFSTSAFTSVYLNSSCNSSSKLVPLCAVAYELTEQNCARWSADIAEHRVNSDNGYAALWDVRETAQFIAVLTALTDDNPNYIVGGEDPKVVPLVHNEFGVVRSWRIEAGAQPQLSARRIGIALYERPCFDIMGFDTEPVCRRHNPDTMRVCGFTVRTLCYA